MKWFRHNCNSNINPVITKLENEFGPMGYSMYFKLIEIIISSMEKTTSPPRLVLPVGKLASYIGCKNKKLKTFLEYLQDIPGINIEWVGKNVSIEDSNITKLLDKNAHSSSQRYNSGAPTIQHKPNASPSVYSEGIFIPEENQDEALLRLQNEAQNKSKLQIYKDLYGSQEAAYEALSVCQNMDLTKEEKI